MRRDHVRHAVAERDDGLRKISKVTWRAGAAGVVCSAVMVVAFGHHSAVTTPSAPTPAHSGPKGSILVPSQPPTSSQGTGQVTSGAS
jgi:hypothetical protein